MMIGWNYKGPFHIWEKETKEEKAAAADDQDLMDYRAEEVE